MTKDQADVVLLIADATRQHTGDVREALVRLIKILVEKEGAVLTPVVSQKIIKPGCLNCSESVCDECGPGSIRYI